MKHSEEIISILQEEIAQYDNRTRRSESGTILEIGDGIATVYGLDRVVYGELVEFETGARGIALNLERDSVGVVLLGSEAGLHEGSWVKRTRTSGGCPCWGGTHWPDGQRIGGAHRRLGAHRFGGDPSH